MPNQTNDFDHIKHTAHRASVTPRPELWDRLEGKLDDEILEKSKRRTTAVKRIGQLVTCSVLLICSWYIWQESNKETTPGMGQIASWEDLDDTQAGYYDTDKVHLLRQAYTIVK